MYHSHWACPPTRLPSDYGTILFRRDLPLIITMTISILQWNVRGFKSHRTYLLPLLDSLHPRITRLRLGTSLLRHGHLFNGQVPVCQHCGCLNSPDHLLLHCPAHLAHRVPLHDCNALVPSLGFPSPSLHSCLPISLHPFWQAIFSTVQVYASSE